MNNQRQLSKVSIHDLSSRFKSKREMHTFLSNDGHAYLPKLESINIEFMKAVITGRKEVRALLDFELLVRKKRCNQSISCSID